ncbi:hypothetical protein ACFL5A_04030 [Gemmatimonadota bacterium]
MSPLKTFQLVSVPFAVFALSACQAEPPPPVLYATRDSAGITIVENAAPVWGDGEGWTLTEYPVLTIGTAVGSPEYAFQDVRGAVGMPDGSIVVADRGAQHLQWYDSLGQHLRTLGRKGEGPGEFEGLIWCFRVGDSVLAFDERLQRTVLFGPDGSQVRTVRLEGGPGMVRGVFGDGSVLMSSVIDRAGSRALGYQRPNRVVLRLDSQGRHLDSLPTFPDDEVLIQQLRFGSGGSGFGLMPPPFGRKSVFAVRGNSFVAGAQNREEIGSYSSAGALQTLLRWPGEDRLVTQSLIDRRRENELGGIEDPDTRRRIEGLMADEVYPDSLPAHGRILFDGAGNLWVESYRMRGSGVVPWRVFDSQLRWLGSVEVPQGLMVYEVGEDYLLGMSWDEMEVEYIKLFGLLKAG